MVSNSMKKYDEISPERKKMDDSMSRCTVVCYAMTKTNAHARTQDFL